MCETDRRRDSVSFKISRKRRKYDPMHILKLLAVSAAYGVLLAFCLSGCAHFALGASFVPIAVVFWGRQLYRRIQDNNKFIDFGLSALQLLLIGIPYVIAVPFIAILTALSKATQPEMETVAFAMTIVLEWLVYVLIWTRQAIAYSLKQKKLRAAQLTSEKEEQKAAERRAYLLAEQEKERQAAQRTRQQNDLVQSQHEHEEEFYRLREETVGLFLKHHALLKDEIAIASITKEYEERQSSIHDSWNDFLLFNKRWRFRILVGAARNNLLTDYATAQSAIEDVFPSDQFLLLVKDALRRDAKAYDSEACIERLSSLHDKIVQLFHDRSSDWQSKRDANKAEAYDEAFAEIDNEPKGPSPFDDDNRVTCQHDVG
jgi:hypothetical protein